MLIKPAFCICENKGVYQLCSNCTADQWVCFRYIDSKIRNFKPLAFFRGCTAWFVLDLVRNPENKISHDAAKKLWRVP